VEDGNDGAGNSEDRNVDKQKEDSAQQSKEKKNNNSGPSHCGNTEVVEPIEEDIPHIDNGKGKISNIQEINVGHDKFNGANIQLVGAEPEYTTTKKVEGKRDDEILAEFIGSPPEPVKRSKRREQSVDEDSVDEDSNARAERLKAKKNLGYLQRHPLGKNMGAFSKGGKPNSNPSCMQVGRNHDNGSLRQA
jgi:hypothetical protein